MSSTRPPGWGSPDCPGRPELLGLPKPKPKATKKT